MNKAQIISRKAFLTLSGIVLGVALFAACGSEGSDGGGGNKIYGELAHYVGTSARTSMLVQGSDPLAGYIIEIRDSKGTLAASVVVDSNGNFSITGVAEGDYTLAVVDPDTGEEVVTVNITILAGDNVKITGVFSGLTVSWEISFEADGSSLNDNQMKKAEKLAKLSGKPVSEILDMRASGMGWGQIAHELGLHPGNLGMGHKDGWEPKKSANTKKDVKGKGSGKGK